MIDENAAYQRLASAIVLRAVKDYRFAKRRLERDPEDIWAREMATECEKFFRSDWCYALSGMDDDYLMGKLNGDTT